MVEGGEELEVSGGSSSEERLWVRDLVAEVLVDFGERIEDFLMSGASFFLSGLGLMEGF